MLPLSNPFFLKSKPHLALSEATLNPKPYTFTQYLGSIISWKRPFEEAFKQCCGLAEAAYKKLRLVWNSSLGHKTKLHIFQSSFVPILTYGLDALTLTTPLLKRVDGFYYRFLRKIVGIKASYYSGSLIWRFGTKPTDPDSLAKPCASSSST